MLKKINLLLKKEQGKIKLSTVKYFLIPELRSRRKIDQGHSDLLRLGDHSGLYKPVSKINMVLKIPFKSKKFKTVLGFNNV